MRLSFLYKVCRTCPEHQCRKCLVCDAEEFPCSIEVHLAAEERHRKDRKADQEPVLYWLLIKFKKIRKRKTKASERRITRCDRTYDHSQQGNHGTCLSKPALAYKIDKVCGLCILDDYSINLCTYGSHRIIKTLGTSAICNRSCRPYHSHYTLGNHGTIKHRACIFLILKTTCHHRRLSGMES